MALTITDTRITSDDTRHTATYDPTAAGGVGAWTVSWLPDVVLDRDAAITAMTVAAQISRAHVLRPPWPTLDARAHELGLSGAEATYRVLTAAPTPAAPGAALLPPEVQIALDHLLAVARRPTGGGRRAANFLLAWWNATDNGGFDLTDLWELDHTNRAAVLHVFQHVATVQRYPDAYGYGAAFEALWQQWRADDPASRERTDG